MRRLYIPGVAFLAFGYPLTTVWFLQFDIASPLLNAVVKALTAALLAAALGSSLLAGRRFPARMAPVYIFLFLYGIRLLHDVLVEGIVPPFTTTAYVLSYFFALTLVPALAVGISYQRSDLPLIHRWFYWMLILVNVSLIFYVFSVGYAGTANAMLGRFEVLGEEESTTVINPIVVSLMGAALAIFVLGRLAILKQMSALVQGWHLALFGLGVANMLLGGSRGPVVGFAVAVLVVGVSILYALRGRTGQLSIRPRILLYLAVLFGGLVFLATREGLAIGVFERFRTMLEPGGRMMEARDFIYAAAWQDFLGSPLIGNSYLTMGGIALPHNVPLEAVAALGIIGGLGVAYFLWLTVWGIWNGALMRQGPHGYSLALLAAAFLVLTMTSGSISQSPELWIVCVVAICMAGPLAPATSPGVQRRAQIMR